MYADVFCVKDHLLHPETGKTRDQYLQREQHHQGWVATPHITHRAAQHLKQTRTTVGKGQ